MIKAEIRLVEICVDRLNELFTIVANTSDDELIAKVLDASLKLNALEMSLDQHEEVSGFVLRMLRHAISEMRVDIERMPFSRFACAQLSEQIEDSLV